MAAYLEERRAAERVVRRGHERDWMKVESWVVGMVGKSVVEKVVETVDLTV